MKRFSFMLLCLCMWALLVSGCSSLRGMGRGQTSVTPIHSELLKGIGILGDSFYDEYQGSDRRGGDYHRVTFNSVELLARNRGLNFGPWQDWGGVRREGFGYNWAVSGATSASMIGMGQHSSVAEQIKSGEVTFVLIGIGANDFSPYSSDSYKRIYDRSMSDDELQAKIDTAIANVTLAVDTVQQAGARGVAITLFTQWELDPALPTRFPDAEQRQRVANAIDAVNSGLQKMASARGVAVIDQNRLGMPILERLNAQGILTIGGEEIDFLHNGDEPHHARLADGQHLGTVISGLVANYYFIDTWNQSFGENIPPLSDEEILESAGL